MHTISTKRKGGKAFCVKTLPPKLVIISNLLIILQPRPARQQNNAEYYLLWRIGLNLGIF